MDLRIYIIHTISIFIKGNIFWILFEKYKKLLLFKKKYFFFIIYNNEKSKTQRRKSN